MHETVRKCILLGVILRAVAQEMEIGDLCVLKNGTMGTCEDVMNCASAKEELRKRIKPVHCGFVGKTPIVCCANEANATENRPTEEPVRISEQTKKPLRISEQKCKEFLRLDTFYEPLLGGGGIDADPKEFPHMALLGYNNTNGTISYQCGGSLISEQHVLTAAHCLESRELGRIAEVRLGDLDVDTDEDDAEPQDFTVAKAYAHPDYDFQSFYNDIAILKLDRPVNITTYVKPACLQTTFKLERNYLQATGWGALYYGGDMYNLLQKLEITNLPPEDCLPTYRPQPKLERGIDPELQICGGDREKSVDTCQGDSGGPLQLLVEAEPPVHRIIGITSFGISCLLVPGIYTRVSRYISWIESVVWLNPENHPVF